MTSRAERHATQEESLRNHRAGSAQPVHDRENGTGSVELSGPGPDTMRAIQAFIEERIDDSELGPERIAEQFHMSRRSLHRLFARSGLTVCAWIKHRRLEACRLALASPASNSERIAEIASRYGLTNPAFFSREFAAQYHVSPRDYRAWAWRAQSVSDAVSDPIDRASCP